MWEIIGALAILLIFGVLMCFFGKRLFYPLMAVALFFGGLALGLRIFGTTTTGWLAGATAGIVLCILTKFLYKFLVFCSGALFGFLLSTFICGLIGDAVAPYALYISIVLAVIIGVCAVKWSDQLIIISTAGSGAYMLALTAVFLFMNITHLDGYVNAGGFLATLNGLSQTVSSDVLSSYPIPCCAAVLVLFIAGIIVQEAARRKK